MRFLKASFACILLLSIALANAAHAQAVMKYIVMRVDFQDSGVIQPRYSRQEVEQLLVNVTDLFTKNSNNAVKVEFVVTDLFRLPKNKADYGSGALEELTLTDALASAPAAVKALWPTDVHAIVVLLSQTWDRGGSYYAARTLGPGGAPIRG